MEPDSLISRARNLYDSAWAWCRWKGPARLAVSCAVGVCIVCAGWLLVRSPAPTIESQIERVATSAPGMYGGPSTSTTSPLVIVVHVAGAVKRPGVVFLPGGSRANDALRAVGGFTSSADVNAVNLAMVVHDGDQFFVPSRSASRVSPAVEPPQRVTRQPSGGSGNSSDSQQRPEAIDINTANSAELDSLPGIGPSTAEAIVAWRTTHGPFESVDSLLDVRGIGEAKLDAIRSLVRV